ncbi:MAG: hypothetical protein Q6M04_06020 [Thermostichus sp. BF3_bins_97]
MLRSLDMRESVIYQEWRAEALREGLEEGRKEGIQLGEALLEFRSLEDLTAWLAHS